MRTQHDNSDYPACTVGLMDDLCKSEIEKRIRRKQPGSCIIKVLRVSDKLSGMGAVRSDFRISKDNAF